LRIIVCDETILNAIDKLFHLLEQFTEEKSQWGVRELSARTGLTPNLTHWYLKNLERNRVVRKDSNSEKYELGYRIFEIGSRASKYAVIKKLSYPILKALSLKTKGTVVLRVLEGGELICLAVVESPSSLRVHYAEGSRVPCNFGCVGKLLMAYLDENKAAGLVRKGLVQKFTKRTVLDLGTLKREWAKIRARGWACTSGEGVEGARAVAAPVRDASGAVCAGLGVTFPAISLPNAKAEHVAREVVRAASEISHELNWTVRKQSEKGVRAGRRSPVRAQDRPKRIQRSKLTRRLQSRR
jgi:IclR family KDG regulon transcriptional repressor